MCVLIRTDIHFSALLPLQLCLTFIEDQSGNYLSVCNSAAAASVTILISTFILIQPGCFDPNLFRYIFMGLKNSL